MAMATRSANRVGCVGMQAAFFCARRYRVSDAQSFFSIQGYTSDTHRFSPRSSGSREFSMAAPGPTPGQHSSPIQRLPLRRYHLTAAF